MPLALAIEVDEWYFRARRMGKRGRGSAGKLPVFGILKRGGHVYNQVIPDPKATALLGIRLEGRVPDSRVYTHTD